MSMVQIAWTIIDNSLGKPSMWHQFRSIAARLGLTTREVEALERKGDASYIEDPVDPGVQIAVRRDPDWVQRMGEAWNETLINSRRESAGTILVEAGQLEISNANTPSQSRTVQVVPGQYEVILTVAHMGSKKRYDYEEHVSHAVVLLEGNGDVTAIEPLTDGFGIEIGLETYEVAFAEQGVLQRFAGDHAGRWSLKKRDLFNPTTSDANKSDRKWVRAMDDHQRAVIMFGAGYGRGDYPLFGLADAGGNVIGILMDFFVDNRP